VEELTDLRGIPDQALTPRMLVRKAILLQFEDTADGTPQEVEAALEAAIERDDNYIEAYIELGHYYFAVQDNAQRARSSFLKALNLLRDMNVEIIRCLVECDEELHPRN